ncbi:GIY-YIG nuclease family protein [Xanthomonas phaseoli]|uniref:GIY-YIG nuclease family protein n=1 Tax=Xanthomonas phaseoli TaxID=1985254 RepID=UPI0013305901|nr:GIY-YIG nuclease family protein [Xanthomonas phaseoli]
MGLSVAKDELYYIYVLRVDGGGWYVGSTQNFERRMRSHFDKGGAVATKERRVLAIEEVFELRDYQIRTDCAHERAEVLIAQRYAKLYGMNSVRGAKHGKGWDDQPSPGNLRDIERYNKFATSIEGERLLAALRRIDHLALLPNRLNGALTGLASTPASISTS